MSDLFAMLGRSARALDAQRSGLDVAGQNIANVNTPGYVRRSVVLAEARPPDANTPGGGVDVERFVASRAPLVEARLRYEWPAAGREGAVADQLAVIEGALGQPGASLDAALAQFYNTYAALGQSPTSSTARQQVVVQGQSLTRAFNDLADRFEAARRSADGELRTNVAQVNALAGQLADINHQISQTDEQNALGLYDQQSEVIKALSTLIDLNVITRPDGALDVSIGNGRALVIGDTAYQLSLTTSSSTGYVNITTDGAAVTTDVTAEIAGGRIGGLLRVRDTLIPGYATRLDQLAYSVATDVNAIATTGYDLNGTAGTNFFTPPAGVTNAARLMAVNSAVVADHGLVVTSSTTAAGNNDLALAIGALQDLAMTGGTARPVEGWSNLVYVVASDADSAKSSQSAHQQMAHQLSNLWDQTSGVSIDEEAALLLRFQRAYEANARFFQVVDETLSLLMQLGGR